MILVRAATAMLRPSAAAHGPLETRALGIGNSRAGGLGRRLLLAPALIFARLGLGDFRDGLDGVFHGRKIFGLSGARLDAFQRGSDFGGVGGVIWDLETRQ